METTPVPVNLSCRKCRHEWQERVELPMDVGAFLARARAWGKCPNCGSSDQVCMGELKVSEAAG